MSDFFEDVDAASPADDAPQNVAGEVDAVDGWDGLDDFLGTTSDKGNDFLASDDVADDAVNAPPVDSAANDAPSSETAVKGDSDANTHSAADIAKWQSAQSALELLQRNPALILEGIPGAREAIAKELGIELPQAQDDDAIDPDDYESVVQYVVKKRDFLKEAPQRLQSLQDSFSKFEQAHRHSELSGNVTRVAHDLKIAAIERHLGISLENPTAEDFNLMSSMMQNEKKDLETAMREVYGKRLENSLAKAKPTPKTLRQQTAAMGDRPRAFASREEELAFNWRQADSKRAANR